MQSNNETDFKQNDTFKHKFLCVFFTQILFSQNKQRLENLIMLLVLLINADLFIIMLELSMIKAGNNFSFKKSRQTDGCGGNRDELKWPAL